MARSGGSKNSWALVLLILSGLVLFGFLGSLANKASFLSWLNYGWEFGLGKNSPAVLDLNVIVLEIKLVFDITIASIFGALLGIFVYKII